MNRDLRDPSLLGEGLISLSRKSGMTIREVADLNFLIAPDYSSNLGPIEKYGRPQDLPSTLPN